MTRFDDGERAIPFGQSAGDGWDGRRSYPLNALRTSKYTWWNFLPLNVWEQLHKAANTYFLILSLIMFLGVETGLFAISITGWSTLGPLLLMMTASAALALADDWRRRQSDEKVNRAQAHAIRMGGAHRVYLDTVRCADIAVGDILVVTSEEDLPADIVPVACSGCEGGCYVSTANLDGETNLKLKSAVAATQEVLCRDSALASTTPLLNQAVEQLSMVGGSIVAEAPTESIFTFSGRLRLAGADKEELLGSSNILLRGTQLRNTAWCIGVVVYTGPDTRMVMNSSKTPLKLANLERVINRAMIIVLGAQALMALLSDILFCGSKEQFLGYWYLYPPDSESQDILLPDIVGYWFTFFILYSNLMPISLYAAMEICNYVLAYFLKNDLAMYDESQDLPAVVRSTNLCHELGQVSYVFSDKTGTLTQNVMDLKRVSIAGEVFGEVGEERGFSGGEAVASARSKSPPMAAAIDSFLEVLAVSHTVMVTRDQSGSTRFEAESPDEGALVDAAGELGWRLRSRVGQAVSVEVGSPGAVRVQEYKVLALNSFTSARKRMSVVVETPAGELLLLVKGADNVMLERARQLPANLQGHLSRFAEEGLRTLVLGRRSISQAEFAAWRAEYDQAQRSAHGREALLAAAAERIEVQLEILGATAIEDKLQVGVAETITQLYRAGIKLWVLTGDKLETARNIGFSSRVLTNDMDIMVLDSEAEAQFELDLAEALARAQSGAANGVEVALLVTGKAIEVLGRTRLQRRFLELTSCCRVLIVCRVSPAQKREMVELVRNGVTPTPVTLAIGDGANDVPMIQAAHVGIGMAGKEGRQAVNSSDFAIAQFRYLTRLLLVHGRWNYRRMCKFILYSFWKNAVLTLLLFYYTFISGYSGTSMFTSNIWTSFNVILFWPIIATGVMDRDVSEEQALQYPSLYQAGRSGTDLNLVKMIEMLLSAFVHSVIIFMVMSLAFNRLELSDFGDYYSFGTGVFSWLVLAMNYRVAFITTTMNWVVVFAIFVTSFLLYVVGLAIYCQLDGFDPYMFGVGSVIAATPLFWIGALVVPLQAMMLDSFKAYLMQAFLPNRSDLVLELAREGKLRDCPLPQGDSFITADGDVNLGGSVVEATASTPLASAVQERQRSGSSFAAVLGSFHFDHPDGSPRLPFGFRNPTVGDTSFLATARRRTDSRGPPDSSDSSGTDADEEQAAAERNNRPSETAFAQQQLPSFNFVLTWRRVVQAALVIGTLFIVVGLLVIWNSNLVVQVRVQYEGAPKRHWDVMEEEQFYHHCPSDAGYPCDFSVTLPHAMEPPIMVVYTVDPLYQNYYKYQQSVIFDELRGDEVPEWQRERMCKPGSTRETPSGEQIFPCGLIATSVFNDSLEVLEPSAFLDKQSPRLTTQKRAGRFRNPPGYPERPPGTSWLYERYPATIGEDLGVASSLFELWMFPGFFARIQNPYAVINTGFSKGDNLTLRIHSRFDAASIGASKEFVITTQNFIGGRKPTLGYVLIISGCISYFMAVIVCGIQLLCPRKPGRPRLRRSVLGAVGWEDWDPDGEESGESGTDSDGSVESGSYASARSGAPSPRSAAAARSAGSVRSLSAGR